MDFKKAFEIYTSSPIKTSEIKEEIGKISDGLNRKRTIFEFPDGHKIQITSYWLVGFTDGEGSFGVKQDDSYKGNLSFRFVLSQSDLDLPLMEAIKVFLINLPEAKQSGLNDASFVHLSVNNRRVEEHHKKVVSLTVTQSGFIKSVLIPFFDSRVLLSKKQLDYEDWKSIILLKEKGHQYTEEGLKLIQLIRNQMNKFRLSSSGSPLVDRKGLNEEIKKRLEESVYEIKENGRIWIKSENRYMNAGGARKEVQMVSTKGDILQIFKSNSEAAKILGVSRGTVQNRIKSSQVFSFENKDVYLKG